MAIRKRNDDEYEFSHRSEYREDCLRIKSILNSRGYEVDSLDDCYKLWSRFSDSMAAGWMGLHDDEDVFSSISYYLDNDGS